MDWSFTIHLCVAAVLCLAISSTDAQDACVSRPLGMGSNAIPDSDITSSSHLENYEATKGRYSRKITRGAWCPDKAIDSNDYEWIQIDFSEMVNISHILIAGLFDDGSGTKFTRKFKVEFQRTEGEQWTLYTKNDSQQLLPGTSTARGSGLVELQPPLLAARVRVIPYAEQGREEVCLRLEFYGCKLSGVATYSAPHGDTKAPNYMLVDHTYDGKLENNRFSRGLGLLTDSILGASDFTSTPRRWLGWRADAERDSVMLLFEMDHLRNVTQIRIHANNQFRQDIRVFRRAQIFSSSDGAVFTPDPIVDKSFTRDLQNESSKSIQILLPDNTVAKFLKIVLEFDAPWLLLSEVSFTSELANGSLIVPTTTSVVSTTPVTTARPQLAPVTIPAVPDTATESSKVTSSTTSPDDDTGAGDSGVANQNAGDTISNKTIGVIVGACTAVLLIVAAIIVLCCIYIRRKAKQATPNRDHFNGVDPSLTLQSTNKHSFNGLPNYDCERDLSDYDHHPLNARPLPPCPNTGRSATLQSSGYISDSGPQYACIPIDMSTPNQFGSSPLATLPPGYSPRCQQCYNAGLLTMPASQGVKPGGEPVFRMNQTLPAQNHSPNNMFVGGSDSCLEGGTHSYEVVQPDGCSPYDASNYRSSPASALPNIQGTSGSSVYGTHMLLPAKQLEDEIPHISRNCLVFIEKLGAGQYGEVQLCEYRTGASKRSGEMAMSQLVAVKTLQPNANEEAKLDFNREIRIMNKLRHDNIVQVLGLCAAAAPGENIAVVTEYMNRGDLHQFLQKSVPDSTSVPGKVSLTQTDLLTIAAQIARGMSYLEQMHITHRDLAARNCLISDDLHVKISDFGMSRSLYSQQYYKVEGRAVLPIRWMAWESVITGRFTTKSDVWSFGVTLWEIFMFAREQPFSMLSDEDIIANCMNYYRNILAETTILPKPAYCPKEVYDLMQACWNVDFLHRPLFKDISAFLQPNTARHSKSSSDSSSMTRLTTC